MPFHETSLSVKRIPYLFMKLVYLLRGYHARSRNQFTSQEDTMSVHETRLPAERIDAMPIHETSLSVEKLPCCL